MKKLTAILVLALALNITACQNDTNTTNTESQPATTNAEFVPSLDEQTSATIDIAGFMGNFEALDEVINAFNEIYPNVTFSYDHNTSFMLNDYLSNNENIDLFMTSDQNIWQKEPTNSYVADKCLDLSNENIDVSSLIPDAVKASTVNDKLVRVPIMMQSYGIVANLSLLKSEGLSVPQNYSEFLKTLDALKEKGYTPLQGSQEHLYGELMMAMAMNILSDDSLTDSLLAGEDTAYTAIKPVFERLEEIIDKGYTDYELNCTFPEDNYDGSILAFFEGNVPFYVCNTECVSGMQKRESKSETFAASPFDYEFMYAPLGDNGVYAYTEPWYGFSISKTSDNKELAVEFLRFMAQPDTLDNMAATKGLPSVVTDSTSEKYKGITDVVNTQSEFSNDGSISIEIREAFIQTCNDLGSGKYKSADEAAHAFVKACTK